MGATKKFLMVVAIVFIAVVLVGFAKYPEVYLSTWRYQLKNDIDRGDEMAIEYYNENYVANGIYLFGEH